MPLSADEFADLYHRHAEALMMSFPRRTCDSEAAVDLTAETFAAAFRDRHAFRGEGADAIAAWLYGIARHQLTGYYRRGSVERRALARLGVERRALTDTEIDRVGQAKRQLRVGLPLLHTMWAVWPGPEAAPSGCES